MSSTTGERSALRLTPRGKAVRATLPVAAAVAVLAAVHVPAAEVRPVAARSVLVAPGDSLWSIAVTAAPDRDPRDEIADIARLNGLRDSTVRPGERLRLP